MNVQHSVQSWFTVPHLFTYEQVRAGILKMFLSTVNAFTNTGTGKIKKKEPGDLLQIFRAGRGGNFLDIYPAPLGPHRQDSRLF